MSMYFYLTIVVFVASFHCSHGSKINDGSIGNLDYPLETDHDSDVEDGFDDVIENMKRQGSDDDDDDDNEYDGISDVYDEDGTQNEFHLKEKKDPKAWFFSRWRVSQTRRRFVLSRRRFFRRNCFGKKEINGDPSPCGNSGKKKACLRVCNRGTKAIQRFCRTLGRFHPATRAACWAVQFADPVACKGFCYNNF